ncbi:MAG: HAMP domain-containing sensor histidine kinase [Ornithinimicrobium sp.]
MAISRWTLRRRLVLVIVALLTAISLIIGLVSVVALNAFLTDRVDAQLQSAVQRSTAVVDRAGPGLGDRRSGDGEGPGPDFLLAPGQGPNTVAALILDDVVVRAAVLDETGTPQSLTSAQDAELLALPADATPHTVELGGDIGDYRAISSQGPDGTQVVTALPLREAQAAVSRLSLIILVVTLLGLLIAVGLAAAIVRSTLRPLQRVAQTATQVAQLPLHSGQVSLAARVPQEDTDPDTEVGQVGAALNRMLGHVEDALTQREVSETRTRQFVADASHELRTPLAAILGYAELTRRTPHDLPPDVAHAMGRVESEAHRMTGLVQDLLLLARLDTGPILRRESVDLRRLLTDAVSDAHASGRQHTWSLSLPEEEMAVLGDPDQLHQIVANLLTNARVHTPDGTAVTATLSRAAADSTSGQTEYAVIEIMDTGPGIPRELQDSVFERFARGDTSRSRRAGSTGLGLAIVAAIASAHGGTVHVRSESGTTVFTVRLPLQTPQS